MLNYEPEKTPTVTLRQIEEAKKQLLQLVHMICVPESEIEKPENPVSFFALVPAIPRIGELVEIQDGKVCLVERIWWRVVKQKTSGDEEEEIVRLVPNVLAIWKDHE